MTAGGWLLLVLFLAVAAMDWAAVHARSKALEYLCKPGCMLVLLATAASLDGPDGATRSALIVAIALSAVGDVFLMIRGRSTNLFVAGLGSFLLAHLAYVVAFWLDGVEPGGLGAGFAVGAVLITAVGRPVLAAVRRGAEPELATPVAAYVGVISLMVLSACGTLDPFAVVGGVLFATSDALIARDRFVRPAPWAPLAIIVTYHLAQGLLVVSFG